MIELHPKACETFDERVDELSCLLQSKTPAKQEPQEHDPDVHISAHITDDDIHGMSWFGHVDHLGNSVDRWIMRDGQLVGFGGESFQKFEVFCASIQNTDAFCNVVSQKFIEDRVFEWLTGETTPAKPFSEFIQEEVRDAQRTGNHWIPIANLRITRPVQIGRVVFRRVTKAMIDALEKSLQPFENEEMRQAVEGFVLRQRRQVQGYTAGTITITAESDRGRELAFEAIEAALAMFRFFEPGSVDPGQTSFVMPLGQESRGIRVSFAVDGDTPVNWEESQLVKRSMVSVYDAKFLEEFWPNGLAQVSAMIGKPKQTKYQAKLIEALTVYSRVSISTQLSDKLVYALVALESVFLKNSSEPIAKNLGERIAFLIGHDMGRRKEIVATTDQIYGIRSRLLHHGKQVPDGEDRVREFLMIAWSALHALIMNADQFETIDELLTQLDNRKMA